MSDPSDGGDSEYNIITCVQCSAEVGKVYVRTSHETAKLQDLISLSTDAVCSYQLGRHEMRVQGTGDLNPLSEERVTRLEEQMVKVENVLVLFNERWHAMESALRQLQQRVDVVSTPSQRHGMAWGMGPTGACSCVASVRTSINLDRVPATGTRRSSGIATSVCQCRVPSINAPCTQNWLFRSRCMAGLATRSFALSSG